MKVAIIYSSITGNTKLLAETIKSDKKKRQFISVNQQINNLTLIFILLILELIKVMHQKIVTENHEDKNLEVSLKIFEDALTHSNKKDLESIKKLVNKILY